MGENSLRVRATCSPAFEDALQALLPAAPCQAEIIAEAESLTLRNGNITATLNLKGQLAFYNQRGELLLEEMWRQRSTVGIGASEKSQDKYVSALKLDGREFKPLMGENISSPSGLNRVRMNASMAWVSINSRGWI